MTLSYMKHLAGRISFRPFLLGLLLVLVACQLAWARNQGLVGKARFVPDGDTIILEDGSKVRLTGIDAPEKGNDGKPGQYYSEKSRKALERMIKGRKLRVLFPGKKKDRYGRFLGWLVLEDGTEVNLSMVLMGYAFYYPHKDQDRGLGKRLLKAQRESLAGGHGFWPKVLSMKKARQTFVGNPDSRRAFHKGCDAFGKVARKRGRVVFKDLKEVFEAGYVPARPCTPWP